MYSRFPRPSDRPIRLPEHYSGCAFSEIDPSKQETAPQPADHPQKSNDLATSSYSSCSPTALFGGLPSLFPGGLQFEELLLMGLIVLLARAEQESDVVLWLVLLLFCK